MEHSYAQGIGTVNTKHAQNNVYSTPFFFSAFCSNVLKLSYKHYTTLARAYIRLQLIVGFQEYPVLIICKQVIVTLIVFPVAVLSRTDEAIHYGLQFRQETSIRALLQKS